MPVPHPFTIKTKSPAWALVNPVSSGLLFSAITAAAFARSASNKLQGLRVSLDKIPGASQVPDRVYVSLLGFALGYCVFTGLDWVRLRLLKRLLAYQGWVTDSRSFKTKAWAVLLKLCKGPQPHSTFQFQSCLPKQPLPSLDQTLDKWLEISRPILTEDEYELTKDAVEEFRNNEGPALQKYLEKKSKKEDNYIHDYWLSGVYLSSRMPTAINSNFYTASAVGEHRTINQLARAAVITHVMLKFAKLLEEDRLSPTVLQDLVPLCMSGYRHIFNTSRVPDDAIDKLVRRPGKQHIIITRKGQFYKADFFYRDSKGRRTIASSEEIKRVLEHIVEEVDLLNENIVPVAALTAQKRDVWSKQRTKLMEKNGQTLLDVESALFILDLDDKTPKNFSEQAKFLLTGSAYNRWFDKSITSCVFADATNGFNIEHSGLDAMVVITLLEYLMVYEEYENGDVVKDTKSSARHSFAAERLIWNVDGMKHEIEEARKELVELIDSIDVCVVNAKYGKGFMKKQRLSPDGYVQMALQLAYYKMHTKLARTYEPSTGRLYQLGRTEQINPMSITSVAWLKAMEDPDESLQAKKDLLKNAIKYQEKNRFVATVGQGCDRHLFALMCMSMEKGMDMPKIFTDKAWQTPYVLSTSQTPNRAYDYGVDFNFRSCNGGFAPSCYNGYGIAYFQFGDETLNLGVTCWKHCPETDVNMFEESFHQAMEDMKQLFKQ